MQSRQELSVSKSNTNVIVEKTDKDDIIEDLEKKVASMDSFINSLYDFERFDSFYFEQAAQTIAVTKDKRKKR